MLSFSQRCVMFFSGKWWCWTSNSVYFWNSESKPRSRQCDHSSEQEGISRKISAGCLTSFSFHILTYLLSHTLKYAEKSMSLNGSLNKAFLVDDRFHWLGKIFPLRGNMRSSKIEHLSSILMQYLSEYFYLNQFLAGANCPALSAFTEVMGEY